MLKVSFRRRKKKPAAVKVTNQYLRILFLARDNIINSIDTPNYATMPVSQCNCNFEVPSDVEDEW